MTDIPRILLMIESSRTCERSFLRGIARYASLHGPWMFYRKPKFYLTPAHSDMSIAQIKHVDPTGIIVSDTEKIEELLDLGCPTIIHTFKSNAYDVPTVLGDTEQTGKMGADYLLGLGYTSFAYCGIGNYYWSSGRYASFRQRIEQSGSTPLYYELNPYRIRNRQQEELQDLANWLSALPVPLGLMTCADDCSQHIIEACRIANIHVPEQISILGVDNDDMVCELSSPPLSSIAMNFEAAGYQSAELLDQMIAHGEPEQTSITVRPTHIEVRASTDILAIDDPDVAAAVRFIRTHSHQLIQVADVLNEVTCCQRLLHQKFKQILGRSVHQEIKCVRIEKIAKMLRETDLTISQIARKLGYSHAHHLSRYFQQEMSITPLAYRKHLNPD